MNTNTGEIVSSKLLDELKVTLSPEELKRRFIEMNLPPTPKQMARTPPRVGLNEPCPCGSGRKFKKCHWNPEQ